MSLEEDLSIDASKQIQTQRNS